MTEIVLITISGEDKPGLTATLTEQLGRHDVNILDMGQAVIHDTLSLGILIEVPGEKESSTVMRDLVFKAHELNVQVKFEPVSEEQYQKWVEAQGKPRYILTLLGRKLKAHQISQLADEVYRQGLNIDKIERLSGRIPLDQVDTPARACVELSLRGLPKDISRMKEEFIQLGNQLEVDVAFQQDDLYRRNRRLVVFDMDSTLIKTEVIDELAEAAGVRDEVSKVTELAMQGELDFKESFRNRVKLLEGLSEDVLDEIADRLPLNDGAERLIETLRCIGYKTAILSGGFTYFGKKLQEKLGIDYVYANELEIKNGKVTGEVTGEIIDGRRKAELLKEIARKEGIVLEQVIAVGDGANDVPMLNAAGLGIAFHAKPLVKKKTSQAISYNGLDGILYLIGVRDREITRDNLIFSDEN